MRVERIPFIKGDDFLWSSLPVHSLFFAFWSSTFAAYPRFAAVFHGYLTLSGVICFSLDKEFGGIFLKYFNLFSRCYLAGTLLFAGFIVPTIAEAATTTTLNLTSSQRIAYPNESALIANLVKANDAIVNAFSSNQLDASFYTRLTNSLNAIQTRLMSGKEFYLVTQLQAAIKETGAVLAKDPGQNYDIQHAYQGTLAVYSNLQEEASALTTSGVSGVSKGKVTKATQTYHFEDAQIIVDGKPVVVKAAKFVSGGTTFVSLYDAELLIRNLTGDKHGAPVVDSNGNVHPVEHWNGKTKIWDIGWEHSVGNTIAHSHGNAQFQIDQTTVIDAPVIITRPKGDPQPTVFVPIWYVQQIVDQLIFTNSTTDVWKGSSKPAKWVISFNRNQQYTTNHVGMGVNGGGSGGGGPVPGWGNWGKL